jgi:uncharacterized protein
MMTGNTLDHGKVSPSDDACNERFQILSLDGGGIRGVFSAAVLEEFEKRLKRPSKDYFDLIAGTSTGGIIAAGLAKGESAAKIVQFYRTHGPKIFTRPKRNKKSWRGWLFSKASSKKLKKFGIDEDWLFAEKYDAENLQSALASVFLEETLEEIDASALVIPAVDLVKGQPVVFKTPHLPNFVRDREFKIADILLATTAAPTYFPAATIDIGTKYIDGGVWANNPTMVAVAEAVKILRNESSQKVKPDLRDNLSPVKVLSIGTGNSKAYMEPPSRGEGIAWWLAGRLIDVMMLSQSQGIHFQSQYLLGNSYDRLDFELPSVDWKLDNVEVIDQLIHLGREVAKSNLPILDKIQPRSCTSFRRY